MELTELNALFTYSERCKAGAKTFISMVENLTEEEHRREQDFITKLVCESWQVEPVDMLAETNTTWK